MELCGDVFLNTKVLLLKEMLQLFNSSIDEINNKDELIIGYILDDTRVQNVLLEDIKTDELLKKQIKDFIQYFDIDIVGETDGTV